MSDYTLSITFRERFLIGQALEHYCKALQKEIDGDRKDGPLYASSLEGKLNLIEKKKEVQALRNVFSPGIII